MSTFEDGRWSPQVTYAIDANAASNPDHELHQMLLLMVGPFNDE